MRKRLLRLLLAAALPWCGSLHAFSPYENFLASGKPRQVGLIARVTPEKVEALPGALETFLSMEEQVALVRAGIRNVSAFTRTIGEKTWLVVHFVQDGNRPYLEAAKTFEEASPGAMALTALIEPHERAGRFGSKWLQMEWINYIRGRDVAGPAKSRLMIVTTVLPEKEAAYRSLHQTVWPGVVDQVVRSNNRDLCVFMTGIDDLLVEFLYLEYVGEDQPADDAMSQSDVINHRWWKLTDACQKGLPGVEGNWVLMDPVK